MTPRRSSKPPTRKPLTLERLHQGALHYLERYAASTEQLRRVLLRRLRRAAAEERAEATAADVEAVLQRLTRAGLLNDAAFAEMKVASLGRRGKSGRAIRRTLEQLGVAPADSGAALAAAEADPAAELRRAIAYARKRRLGPFRPAAERDGRRLRDLAALARQGFPPRLARSVIEAADGEALQALLTEQA